MSRLLKRLKKWRNNPKDYPPWDSVEATLLSQGFEIDKDSGGSHFQISHELLIGEDGYGEFGEFTIAIYKGQTLKAYYLLEIVDAIELVIGLEEEIAKGGDSDEES